MNVSESKLSERDFIYEVFSIDGTDSAYAISKAFTIEELNVILNRSDIDKWHQPLVARIKQVCSA